jgi:SAM-dependent methyltransferase
LEYTPTGVEAARRNFRGAGYEEDRVRQGDIFDDRLMASLEQKFDVVCSFGFIEHFEDPGDVIQRQVRMTKPGGLVIVTIPNLTGIYAAILSYLDSGLLAIHNLRLMEAGAFRRAFSRPDAAVLHCGYYGFLDFDICWAEPTSRTKALLLRCMGWASVLTNIVANVIPVPATSYSSPYLVAVLRKTSPGPLP